jgi:hypothetical protein
LSSAKSIARLFFIASSLKITVFLSFKKLKLFNKLIFPTLVRSAFFVYTVEESSGGEAGLSASAKACNESWEAQLTRLDSWALTAWILVSK